MKTKKEGRTKMIRFGKKEISEKPKMKGKSKLIYETDRLAIYLSAKNNLWLAAKQGIKTDWKEECAAFREANKLLRIPEERDSIMKRRIAQVTGKIQEVEMRQYLAECPENVYRMIDEMLDTVMHLEGKVKKLEMLNDSMTEALGMQGELLSKMQSSRSIIFAESFELEEAAHV